MADYHNEVEYIPLTAEEERGLVEQLFIDNPPPNREVSLEHDVTMKEEI